MIKFDRVSYIYGADSPFEKLALDDVSIEIGDGEFIGLIGHTGSGKSTFVQHLNALLLPTSGHVYVDGEDISVKGANLKQLRQKVGLVFQYPEYQLFEETVEKDIAYGPANLGYSAQEIAESVRYAMDAVGLDYEDMAKRSPFELSGGQKRRVAIAGVLAMRPRILVLDEPTAGLDPIGKFELFKEIKEIFLREGISVILVTHSMEDIARLADRIIVMHEGKVKYFDTPREVFKNIEELEAIGLGVPQVTKFMIEYRKKGADVSTDCITVEEALAEILRYKGRA